jgi:hypothetical protein
VIVLVLAELTVLTKLKVGEVKAAGFKAGGLDANNDVRVIEDA